MSSPHPLDILRAVVHDFVYLVDQAAVFCIWDWQIRESLPTHIRTAIGVYAMENAAIESAMLSARILNDFFKPAKKFERNGRKFKTDIQAHDFGFPTEDFLTEDEAKLLHKRLAHLSTERVSNRGDQWQVDITRRALVRCLGFLEYLKSDKGTQFLAPEINVESFMTSCRICIRRIDECLAACATNPNTDKHP